MANSDATFDLTVIGSGPRRLRRGDPRRAQLGLKTAVVEMAPRPGGTCLHLGCIPTKALAPRRRGPRDLAPRRGASA